ncbi:kinetochore scaffold 1 [Oxyura jamaicensis]|uniref:kinetochore scaffold 1 n=1 Tax=Oxyura jamaicensis TaxID=8884 RepID=UPI0015A71BC6|nr:kinetochore scaffold 1 [Oxyura jamaicensis]XP_035183298.1 kinetochore scaffold 1 [Oxyura jamaicensis]XP_035183299.1 kinetochore scaffold 1 [Oxyura jamaicensis]XP_035183300.1 kinetochore scaffold 1 [Oxyura jamaicensis]
MDKIYADPNTENDNTEHMRGKRLSSILKAPRNPLDDLGNGNELTQDINIEKRRKNSRRVSFANTINCRVFQRDLKNNAAERENEECEADTGNHVLLNQNEEPDSVPCEITGMNTLLHAPIQALVQQTECHDVDNAIQRTNRHDTTLTFSDENEMEMTASHTAVITRNLKNNETDKTEKIDITSFLAGLNSNSGKAEMSKEFHFSFDPTNSLCPSFEQKEDATTVKKINFNEFLMRLKSNEKALNPLEGPEKENLFFIPSQVSEDMARSSVESAYSHEPPATFNVTKIFREQDDGMEMTKCQASDVKNMRSGICESPPEQLLCADVTEAFADDGMDMTTSHTAKMSFPFASVGNQSLNFKKDFPSIETDNYSVVKRASDQQLIVKQDPQLCTNKKTVNVEDTVDTTVLQTFKQETRTLSAILGSVSSETVFRGDKTDLSKCDDMEITGNYTDVIYNESTKGMSSSCHRTFEKTVNTISLPIESRHPALDDVTESLTSLDNRASASHKTNALKQFSGSDERTERVTQDHETASVDVVFDSCRNSVSTGTSKGRLQHRLSSSLLVSLPGEKTATFSGKDMALTKTCIDKADGRNVENEFPPGVSRVEISLASSLGRDKENIEAVGFDVNMKRSQTREMNTEDVEVIIVNKKLGKTNFQASDLISCAKSVCSLQEQKREIAENTANNNSAFLSLQSQEIDTTQPLKKTIQNASASCTNDKTDMFSDDQNMDVTKTHSVVFEVAPTNTVQEYENTHNQNNVISKQLQKQISRFSNNSGVDTTASQTAAIEYRDFQRSSDKQTVTRLSANGRFISSNEPTPSRNTRNVQPAKILGINADFQNSDKQVKTHTMKVVDNALPTREESQRDFLISKTVSSEEDFKNLQSVDGLHLGIEETLLTNTSEQQKRSSQLPFFSEKSVLFPSGENMDLTENCAAMAPDQNIRTILPGRKAAPVPIVEDENKTLSLKREVMMTINNQEQPGCDMYSLVSGKKMLTVTGLKHLHFVDEKTTIFSEDADMDITRSHTVSGENKIILPPKSSSNDISFVSGDKTCVFTHNNDMEISRFDTVAIDKFVEKAEPGGMLSRANRTERKSSKETTGEKTVLFSLSNENNDMEITESHTAAIGHEIVSQKEVRLHSLSSAQPIKAVKSTSNQSDVAIAVSCPADKITVELLRDDNLNLNKEVGWEAPSNTEATVLAMDDMEITKTHNGALEENSLQGRQPNQFVPLCSTIIFTNDKADMEMTKYLPDDESTERIPCEDRVNSPKQVGQEAVSGSKTVIFTLAEDMEITKTHTAVLSGEVWDRGFVPAVSAVPADQTIVFPHKQDDMEITVSHTVAVNNNMEGFENQQASHKSTRQPGLHTASLSACRDEVDSLHVKDLNGEYLKKSNNKPAIPSASSASAFPTEKGAAKVHSGAIPDSVYPVSLPEDTLDVRAPQDLDLATDNSVPVNSQQDLVHPGKLKSKRVSFKLPGNAPLECSEETGVVVSHVSPPIQQLDSLKSPPDGLSTQTNQVLKDNSSRHEDLDTALAKDGAVPVSDSESKENKRLSAEGEVLPTDFQIKSEQTNKLLVSDSPRDPVDPTLAPKLSGILNVCSKLENIRRKSGVVSVPETAVSEQLHKVPSQSEDTLRLGKNTINEQDNLFYPKEQENACLESGAAPIGTNLGMALKDKYQGISVPLGIFQPKLPSRRNPSVSNVQDINAKSSDEVEALVSEANLNTGAAPDYTKSSRQNFSPSQFIAEEFLPICQEAMDSNDSVSFGSVEDGCNDINKRDVSHNEKTKCEETKTCNSTKRALEQDEDLQSLKKLKADESLVGGTSLDLQVTSGALSQSQVAVREGEDPPNLSAKNLDCTHANSSSSLDSVKADTESTIQRCSQMESQLLTDSICEDNLWEKFQSGVITVGEFFMLLQVHIPIQKPRQSHLPASCAVSAPPTPEDLILSQYVYRPKLRIYEEDCQVLSQMIDELKQYVSVQDQPLVNVNKSLWEVMRTCSDEELKSFGAELNKMKSYFIKESKILAHNEKEALYSKLLQSAQEQYEKLQSRIANVDELLKEAESCLADLEADSEWEECETDCSEEMAEEDSESKKLEEELESLKAQEEELQRELSDLETENEQMFVQLKHLQEKEKSCEELLERYNFPEWEISEWSEQQAVFNFLYDSIELTVVFGPPVDGDVFGENPSRKIVSLSFESLLDEEKAPLFSCLVHRLIFQFIESQGCWQEKCPILQYLPQVLHDVSLVVSRCRILGEEIEFLERWGGKFNLLKTDINDTNVKLLFSSSTAFAKFEVTLSLSSNYPATSLPFTVQKQIGNIGHEEISAVLSNVPVGYHYLRRMVSSIHQNLLQDPR